MTNYVFVFEMRVFDTFVINVSDEKSDDHDDEHDAHAQHDYLPYFHHLEGLLLANDTSFV